MLKEQIAILPSEQKSLIAVAYLMSHEELHSEKNKDLFVKLNNFDKNARSIQNAIGEAKKAINELRPKLEQSIGAITAVASIIAESIPVDKIEEYCLAYEMADNKIPLEEPKSSEIDLAGSTSKVLPKPIQKKD